MSARTSMPIRDGIVKCLPGPQYGLSIWKPLLLEMLGSLFKGS